jgi:hypothetical protein
MYHLTVLIESCDRIFAVQKRIAVSYKPPLVTVRDAIGGGRLDISTVNEGVNRHSFLVNQGRARGGQLFAAWVSSVNGEFVPTIQKSETQLSLRTAIASWNRQGVSADRSSQIVTRFSGYSGGRLGCSIGNTIGLDHDAANLRWCINAIPNRIDNFSGDCVIWVANFGDPVQHSDLLTVLCTNLTIF